MCYIGYLAISSVLYDYVVAYIKWWYCTCRSVALAHSFVVVFLFVFVLSFCTLILCDIIVEHSFLFLFVRPVSE